MFIDESPNEDTTHESTLFALGILDDHNIYDSILVITPSLAVQNKYRRDGLAAFARLFLRVAKSLVLDKASWKNNVVRLPLV